MERSARQRIPRHLATLIWALVAAAPAAHGGTVNEVLVVTSTIVGACSVAISGVTFGTYAPLSTHASAPLDFMGDITLDCSDGTPVNITLDQGQHPAMGSTDASPLRRMASVTRYLEYNLYTDAGHTQVWGNAPPGYSPPSGSYPVSLSVHGRIPPGQLVGPGSYIDTVVLTATF